MVALHVRPSPYHPVRHAFSDYAVGSTRTLSNTMSTITAAAWAALAVAVWQLMRPWDYRGPATAILAALAVLAVAITRVPTDLEGTRPTLTGRLHYLVAVASFGLAYSLTGDTSQYATTHGWGTLGHVLLTLHWVALVGLITSCIALVVRPARPFFGLVERVFLFAIALFYATFAGGLIFA